mgnify:FL=1
MGKYVLDSEWGTKYPNFKKAEFKCPCGKCNGYGNGIATTLVETLQELRNKYGKLQITSGYRCVAHNKAVGGSTNSKHTKGQAADFYLDGFNNQSNRVNMVNELKKTKYYNYSYTNVNGNHPNMGNVVHLDTKLEDTDDAYKTFVRDLQTAIGAKVDGTAGPETLSKTPTISTSTGWNHKAVKPLQVYLKSLGYDLGKCGVDGKFGKDMKACIKKYQKDQGLSIVDGVVTAKMYTWKKLLKLD